MINIIYLNIGNSGNKYYNEIIKHTNNDIKYNFSCVEFNSFPLSNKIKEKPDIIITYFENDKNLFSFYYELFSYSNIFFIPLIFLIEKKDFENIPTELLLECNDVLKLPIDYSEIIKRIEIALTKSNNIKEIIEIDRLTNLPNNVSFNAKLNDEINKFFRYKRPFTLALINIINFGKINKSFGKYAGDECLSLFSEYLIKKFRTVDYLARVRSDKFAVILPETSKEKAMIPVERLLEEMNEKKFNVEVSQSEVSFSINIGIVEYKNSEIETSEFLKHGQIALKKSKLKGKNNLCVFDEDIKYDKDYIFVIDDEETILNVVREVIESDKKYKVKCFQTAEKVIDEVLTVNPALIILDIMLPGKDGYEICRELKNNSVTSNIPILILTAKGSPLYALDIGAEDYLLKPFSSDNLLAKIDKLINNSSFDKSTFNTKISSELTIRSIDRLQLNGLLNDSLTQLPTLALVINKVYSMVRSSETLGLIYIDIAKFNKIELTYGEKIFDRVLKKTSKMLREMQGVIFRKDDLISVSRVWDDDFIIFLSPPRYNEKLTLSDIFTIKDRIKKFLDSRKSSIIGKGFSYQFEYYVGYSLVELNPEIKFERLVYNSVKDAMQMAYKQESEVTVTLQHQLKNIIKNKDLDIFFQPIVAIKTGEIFGYEALARGPKGTLLYNPDVMFNIATELNLVWELERIAKEKAVDKFLKSGSDKFLFLNVEPGAVSDPELRKKAEMKSFGIDNKKIILEITERTNVKDLPVFKEKLKLFKESNIRVAIDDAGSGYASLLFIAELKPDFLKIDISLIRNIHRSDTKSDIVKALANYGKEHDITVIAEGVETIEELEEIKGLDIDCVQGYFFQKPSPTIQEKIYNPL